MISLGFLFSAHSNITDLLQRNTQHFDTNRSETVTYVKMAFGVLISLKRDNIGPRLLLMTNHTRFRLVPKSTTLDDLGGWLCTLFQNTCAMVFFYSFTFSLLLWHDASRGFLATARFLLFLWLCAASLQIMMYTVWCTLLSVPIHCTGQNIRSTCVYTPQVILYSVPYNVLHGTIIHNIVYIMINNLCRCVRAHGFWSRMSRKPLKIEARFQWDTNRKWHMTNRMVMWSMTSRDLERSRSWPQYVCGPLAYLENGWRYTLSYDFTWPTDSKGQGHPIYMYLDRNILN